MLFLRNFLTDVADTAQETTGGLDGMIGMMDMIIVVMLFGVGLYALYSAIRLYKEQMLFPNKILYPGDCKPEDCTDEGGFIDYIIPRVIAVGVIFLLMGIGMVLVLYVFKLDTIWINLASMVLPVAVLVWLVVWQRKAAKLFW